MNPVAAWNQQIQEEIFELEILIEAEELNLQNVQNQIDLIRFISYPFIEHELISLRNTKKFILNSIEILKDRALVLHNRKILCC